MLALLALSLNRWGTVVAEQAASTAPLASTSASPWSACATLAAKESFDENVFLQSVTSNAFRHSFVTAVLPSVGLVYKPGDLIQAGLTYSPEVNFYHSASAEDYVSHRVLLSLSGTSSQTKWDVNENFLAIDGSNIGPSFYGPGGAPAGGGPQIRDRRAAMVERGQARLSQGIGDWSVRPVLSGYAHDFRTLQQIAPGYQNYVDRSDWNAGVDLGRQLTQSALFFIGYRYGQQTQAKLLEFPEHYDSKYNRVLFGAEGKPWRWLALSICAGPEFRRYGESVAEGFGDRNVTCPFADSTVTISPTAHDAVTFTAKIFEQPGFSGRSTYLDSTYEMSWRHKFAQRLTVGIGCRTYNTDFLKPTQRNDWILTPNVVASYAFNSHLSSEASYLFDEAFSLVPNTQGREYTRNMGSIGVKYAF